MSLAMRIVFFTIIGLIAGLCAWPVIETILFFQSQFTSLLIFNIVLGVAMGPIIGGIFGTGEGIMSRSSKKIRSGFLLGIFIGMIAGVIGFLCGQTALLLIGSNFFNSTRDMQQFGLPLSRSLGWAGFGICIGCVEGIRCRSASKIINGIFGGLIGGITGGLIFEYLPLVIEQTLLARMLGMLILICFIGLFYGFIENKRAKASLKMLNGRLKNKEYLLTRNVTKIAADESPKTEINLTGYHKIGGQEIEIRKDKKDFVMTNISQNNMTCINDIQTNQQKLRHGDVIRVGEAQFLFTRR